MCDEARAISRAIPIVSPPIAAPRGAAVAEALSAIVARPVLAPGSALASAETAGAIVALPVSLLPTLGRIGGAATLLSTTPRAAEALTPTVVASPETTRALIAPSETLAVARTEGAAAVLPRSAPGIVPAVARRATVAPVWPVLAGAVATALAVVRTVAISAARAAVARATVAAAPAEIRGGSVTVTEWAPVSATAEAALPAVAARVARRAAVGSRPWRPAVSPVGRAAVAARAGIVPARRSALAPAAGLAVVLRHVVLLEPELLTRTRARRPRNAKREAVCFTKKHTTSLSESMSGGVLLSHVVAHAVPSAQRGLASGFGMGPGVSPSL